MRPEISSIASTAAALPVAVQDRLAQILDDYLVAIERGAPVTPEELLARHPEDAEHLRRYLSALEWFHAAAAPNAPRPPAAIGAKLRPAQIIGDFQIVREIGRGGMGVVYEAEQLSLRRRVALKILPFAATHDAKQLGRFKNEAQAAAHVQHPNIVPVYAVGEHEGVHYYAMQLVAGRSLAAHLGQKPISSVGTTAPNLTSHVLCSRALRGDDGRDKQPSPTGSTTVRGGQTVEHVLEIARLGVQAADALHTAHEYGIVHRDVKPSNLLVDEHGKLWVTDFGLARCRETSGLTQTGDILGTMRYMSPEQALGRAELVDHRTDIYSLGVTLYELATGHHPSGAASDVELLVGRGRFVAKPLRHWNRHIPVDFQTIVLKAMAEFPHERYASAAEFSDDLRRFLDGKPILASRPNVVNRIGKWTARHRGLVAAAAAVLLVAFAGMATTTLLVTREKMATDRALAVSREQLRRTHTVLDRFGIDLPDQLAAIPGAEGVRYQLLEDYRDLLEDFEQQAADDPQLSSDLATAYSKLGTLAEKLGDRREALARHVAARDAWQARFDAEPANPEFIRNLALAHNNVGLLEAELGRGREALASLETAERLQRMLVDGDGDLASVAAELAATCGNQGLVLRQLNRRDEAAAKFRAAIAILEPLDTSSADNEKSLRTLAASYNNLASLDESPAGETAVDAYRKAIKIQRQLFRKQTVNRLYQGDLARSYNNLGYLFARRREWQSAEACYLDAIRLQEILVQASPMASSYQRDLAISCNNLGMVQSRGGELESAEISFRRALDLQTRLASAAPTDAGVLSNLGGLYNNLGLLCERQQQVEAAERNFRQAVRFQRLAMTAAPGVTRYRELLTNHYANYEKCLRGQSKTQAAETVVRERDSLLAEKSAPDVGALRN